MTPSHSNTPVKGKKKLCPVHKETSCFCDPRPEFYKKHRHRFDHKAGCGASFYFCDCFIDCGVSCRCGKVSRRKRKD